MTNERARRKANMGIIAKLRAQGAPTGPMPGEFDDTEQPPPDEQSQGEVGVLDEETATLPRPTRDSLEDFLHPNQLPRQKRKKPPGPGAAY